MEEIKDLVAQALEKRRVLSKLKAELRAQVFLAIDEQERKNGNSAGLASKTDNPRRHTLCSSHSGSLLVGLVREFLEWTGLEFTLKVYEPEMCIDGTGLAAAAAPATPPRTRQELARELGMPTSADAPLLLTLLEKGPGSAPGAAAAGPTGPSAPAATAAGPPAPGPSPGSQLPGPPALGGVRKGLAPLHPLAPKSASKLPVPPPGPFSITSATAPPSGVGAASTNSSELSAELVPLPAKAPAAGPPAGVPKLAMTALSKPSPAPGTAGEAQRGNDDEEEEEERLAAMAAPRGVPPPLPGRTAPPAATAGAVAHESYADDAEVDMIDDDLEGAEIMDDDEDYATVFGTASKPSAATKDSGRGDNDVDSHADPNPPDEGAAKPPAAAPPAPIAKHPPAPSNLPPAPLSRSVPHLAPLASLKGRLSGDGGGAVAAGSQLSVEDSGLSTSNLMPGRLRPLRGRLSVHNSSLNDERSVDIMTGDRSFGLSHELGGLMPPPAAHGGGVAVQGGVSTSAALHEQASASGELSVSGELLAPPQHNSSPPAVGQQAAGQGMGMSLDGDLSQSNKSLSGELPRPVRLEALPAPSSLPGGVPGGPGGVLRPALPKLAPLGKGLAPLPGHLAPLPAATKVTSPPGAAAGAGAGGRSGGGGALGGSRKDGSDIKAELRKAGLLVSDSYSESCSDTSSPDQHRAPSAQQTSPPILAAAPPPPAKPAPASAAKAPAPGKEEEEEDDEVDEVEDEEKLAMGGESSGGSLELPDSNSNNKRAGNQGGGEAGGGKAGSGSRPAMAPAGSAAGAGQGRAPPLPGATARAGASVAGVLPSSGRPPLPTSGVPTGAAAAAGIRPLHGGVYDAEVSVLTSADQSMDLLRDDVEVAGADGEEDDDLRSSIESGGRFSTSVLGDGDGGRQAGLYNRIKGLSMDLRDTGLSTSDKSGDLDKLAADFAEAAEWS